MNSKQYYPSRIRPRRRSAEQQPSLYEILNNDIRFFRIQTIAFVIFYITLFLLVIGTTDAMLFLETRIQLPFVGVTLPLLGFYGFTPCLLLGWHFLMLFHARQHYRRLNRDHCCYRRVFKQLTLGWFEQIIIRDNKRWAWVGWVTLNICLYWLLPLTVLIGFYYRFADYQDQYISWLHLIIIILDLILIAVFVVWARVVAIITGVVCFVVIGWYQLSIVEPIHNPNTPSDTLKYYRPDRVWVIPRLYYGVIPHLYYGVIPRLYYGVIPRLYAGMIPHLNARGKVLVQLTPSDSAVLDVLHGHDPNPSAADTVNNKLPLTDRSKRLFRFANFKDSVIPRTNFSKAHLEEAYLGGANLAGADLTEVNLTGINLQQANLAGAKLSEVNLGAKLSGANLAEADLRKVNLAGADLTGAHFEGANLIGSHLEGADLTGAHFEGANLIGSHLEGADLRDANLEGANLIGSHLEGADLTGANLEGANLKYANLAGANLRDANLEGANLRRANLAGANLKYANLAGADLNGVNLSGADLTKANLQGAYDNRSKLSFAERVGVQDYLQSNSPLFKHKLTQETINEVKDQLQKNEVSEEIQTRIIDRLQERVGQAADLTDATFRPLTQDIVDEVDRRVRNPEARERLGFAPLP